MIRRHPHSTALVMLMLTSLPAVAGAHEFWLSPTRYDAARGATIEVRALVGTGFKGEEKLYAAPRTTTWMLHTNRATDLRRAAMNADVVWARFVVPDQGGALLAYESGFTDIQLAPADFDRYLALEGLDAPLRTRARLGANAGPGRERYARCAKTWIAGADAHRALQPQRLTLEIVPLDLPGASDRLRVRVAWHGHPLAGVLLKAFHRPLAAYGGPIPPAMRDSVPPAFQARSDAAGVVTVPTPTAGEWMLSAVHMEPCPEKAEADWQSHWASLSFARLPRARR